MTFEALALVAVLLVGADAAAPLDGAADVISLRDGKVLLGEVIESSPRGSTVVIARRGWVESNLAEWSARWQSAEKPALKNAVARRQERLSAWRRERAAVVDADDAVLKWVDHEWKRLSGPDLVPPARLMFVKLSRGEIKGIVRKPKAVARFLRLGWVAGFANVESKSQGELRDALEGRGFDTDGTAPVSLDALLPVPTETETQWLVRRAATEVTNDSGLKFLRTGATVLPEPVPGQAPGLEGLSSVVGGLKHLLGENPGDPWAETLNRVAARGRVGAVATRLEISPDLSMVRVEATLWVRSGADRWAPAGSRTAAVRPDALAPNAGAPLADDPQVKAVFGVAESLGLGQVPADVKRKSLNIGAATQKALSQVRSAYLDDLESRAFPVHELVDDAKNVPAKP
jgi:hypothetical protein